MTARHEVCRTCAHWSPFPVDDGIAGDESSPIGECRCFPQEVRWFADDGSVGFKTAFPSTRSETWCGEWFPERRGDD